MQMAQISLYGVTPRVTSGATPKMMYYCAYTTQTAARITKEKETQEAIHSMMEEYGWTRLPREAKERVMVKH